MLPDLLPKTVDLIERWRDMRWAGEAAQPKYPYQDLPDSARLRYELVSWDNFSVYLDLFGTDPDPFVDVNFKSRKKLEHYIANLLEYNRYSYKHGACDWLLRLADGQCVGVLHLYDLNAEVWDGRYFPCMTGYAIAAPFRRQGLAFEAVAHLLSLIPKLFQRFEVQAEPLVENDVSRALLAKLGFREERPLIGGTSSLWYKQLVDPIPVVSEDED